MTTRRRFLVIGSVVGGVVLVLAAWLGIRVAQAAGALRELADSAGPALDDLRDGDPATLRDRLPGLRESAARAHSATADPIVRAATHLPWIGDDLRVVSSVSSAADALADEPARAVLELADALDGSATGGDLDLSAVTTAAPALADAADIVLALRSELIDVNPDGLTGPVRDAADRLAPLVAADPEVLRSAAAVADRLPALLGADGPRTYLVLALNPAELRTQGGIVGSTVLLTADRGTLTITDQRGTVDLPELAGPALPLTAAEATLYGDRLGRWIQDVVLSPDFPRAAELAAAYWEQAVGGRVDGVLATDPVALTAVLGAAGDRLTVDGQQIAADQVIGLLLRDAYLTYGDPRDGDAFYARTAAAAFGALTQVLRDPASLVSTVTTLTDQVHQGRFRLWSADPADRRALAGTPLAGDFLSGGDRGPAVGVFLDDITAGKLGADLDVAVSATITGCGGPDSTATLAVRLAYHPPADIADYPEQVLGDGGSGVPPGWIATNLSVYSARHGTVGAITRDGETIGGEQARIDGRIVQTVTARIAPGGAQEYLIEVPAPLGALTVWTTPTVTAAGIVDAHCER